MSEPYIIVRGGLVQNTPSLPVLDLDVLDASEFLDAGDYMAVEDLRDAAIELGLTDIADECREWLAGHDELNRKES